MSRETLYQNPIHKMSKKELNEFIEYLVSLRLGNMNSQPSTNEIVALLNIAASERNERSSGILSKTAISMSVLAVLISTGILIANL